MGVDNYTKVVYGWKLDNNKEVEKIQEELQNICENIYKKDIYDMIDDFIVEDTMCNNYFYFGVILGSYDARWDEDGEVIVNSKLVNEKVSEYKKMLKKYPEIEKIFNKYSEGKNSELYIFQQIW